MQQVPGGFNTKWKEETDIRPLGRGLPILRSPKRPYGEEFIAAGDTAVCRKPEDAAEDRYFADDVLCSDALQFQVPTQAAVRKKQVPNGNAPSAEPGFAGVATPGQNAPETEQIVYKGAAMGAPEFGAAAGWTNKFARLDLRSPW